MTSAILTESLRNAAPGTLCTEVSTPKVWRLKNGLVIELRSLKDPNSPVADIHWVKL